MSLDFRIRYLNENDIPQVAAIESTCDQVPFEHADRWLVAQNKGEVFGYIGFKIERDIWISSLAVREDLRRQRVASSLLNQILRNHASVQKRNRIFFPVDEAHVPTVKFCRATGFEFARLARKFFGPDRDAYIFRREYFLPAPATTHPELSN